MTDSFDPDKDAIIFDAGRVDLGPEHKTFLEVSVRRYDDGSPKLVIGRQGRVGKTTFRKLGRLTGAETRGLMDLLTEQREAILGALAD